MSQYSDEDDYNTRSRKSGRSFGGRAMASLGLRSAGSPVLRNDHRDQSHRSHSQSRSRSRDRGRQGKDTREQLVQSAKSALLAGAGEVFRSRKEPGGASKKRVLTAAVSAGAINAVLNSGKEDGQRGSKVKVAESVVGGLAVNYLVNGSRHQDRSRSRVHSRERQDHDGRDREGRHGTALTDRGVATSAGTASVNGNKSRDLSRQSSSSDYDSNGEERKRRKSIGSLARAGMAKLGLGRNKSKDDTIARIEA